NDMRVNSCFRLLPQSSPSWNLTEGSRSPGLIQWMSIALGVFLVGCGSNESDVRAKPKQRGESSHPNSPLEEHENTLEPALSSNVSPSVNAPPDVEELAIVLEKL